MSILQSSVVTVQFVATKFQPRTRATHREHCSMLNSDCADLVATTYGLARDSILNRSRYFHVTDGLPPDCMHDILEGTMQYEIKEMLKALTQQGIISLQQINSRISLFSYSSCDMANKPSSVSLSSADHSLKQSGMYTHVDLQDRQQCKYNIFVQLQHHNYGP